MNRGEVEGRDDKVENVVELWKNRVMEVERRERERRLEESITKSTKDGERRGCQDICRRKARGRN